MLLKLFAISILSIETSVDTFTEKKLLWYAFLINHFAAKECFECCRTKFLLAPFRFLLIFFFYRFVCEDSNKVLELVLQTSSLERNLYLRFKLIAAMNVKHYRIIRKMKLTKIAKHARLVDLFLL